MAKEYKVWVHVEEYDDETEHYQDIGLPYEAGCFEDQQAAENFAADLANQEPG